ncbi:MAG: elongation factor P [Candidatus Latescibacteria bacterium]|nr:elongation factor P [bacterium]MBD3424107.1 elongation factor P [Candidatus Latescibacterota bacterium]
MADTSDFRNGMVMRLDGKLYSIVEFMHVKPGKGGAFVRTKLKEIPDGSVVDKTFRSGEKVEAVRVERRKHQFLYEKNGLYHMMDVQDYSQMTVGEALLENSLDFLKENLEIDILFDEDTPLEVKLPIFVELEVAEAQPGVKGNTAQGGSKNVVLETGAEIDVPLFIEKGDLLKIDTRTGEYIERIK